MELCTSCLTPLAANQILYTPQAKVICAGCANKVDIVDTDKRAAGNIVKNATGALAAGIGSVIVLLFISMIAGSLPALGAVAVSIVCGIIAIRGMAAGNERFTKHLTNAQGIYVWIATVVGWTFCLATLLMAMVRGFVIT